MSDRVRDLLTGIIVSVLVTRRYYLTGFWFAFIELLCFALLVAFGEWVSRRGANKDTQHMPWCMDWRPHDPHSLTRSVRCLGVQPYPSKEF